MTPELALWAGRAVTPEGVVERVRVQVASGRISAVDSGVEPEPGDAVHADATLVPGLVDLQVNGAQGIAFDDPDADARRRAVRYHTCRGTTTLLPTLISAPLDALAAALERLAADVRADPALAGIHLEGPFLAPEKAGVHPVDALLEPDPAALERLIESGGGALALCTLAPERPGALDAIGRLLRSGVVCAAGHTLASAARMRLAIERGLSFVTHLGNACDWPGRLFDAEAGYRRSEPGVIGSFMSDARLRGSLILDGRHLDPGLAAALIRLRGADAVALVSDASPFAGLPPGEHRAWGMRARVHAGGFATAGEGLAGSTITLVDAVRVAVEQLGLPLADAVRMAARTPAHAIGLGERKGSLAAGFDADLLLLDASLRPVATYLAGKQV